MQKNWISFSRESSDCSAFSKHYACTNSRKHLLQLNVWPNFMYTLVFMKLIFLQDFKELNCCCFQNKHSGSACDKLNKFFMSIYFINSSDQNIVPFSYIVTILCWMPRFLVNKRESLVAFNAEHIKTTETIKSSILSCGSWMTSFAIAEHEACRK